MSDLLFTIGSFLVALVILIAVHEFGHFWVARRLGVRVLRFSLGFGKPLLRWTDRRDGTEFVVASLPLGGYVQMLDEREGEVPEAELHRAFNRQVVWKRAAIVAAGPLCNFLLAVALYWGILVVGDVGNRPLIGEVAPASVAETAGFARGDELLRIEDRATPTWESAVFALLVEGLGGQDVAVRVREESGGEVVRWLAGDALEGLTDSPAILANIGLAPARPTLDPVVGEVLEDGAAERVGIRPGDRIVAADGTAIGSWGEWVALVRAHPGTPIPTELVRDGETLRVTITPDVVTEGEERIGRIGVAVALPEGPGERYLAEVQLGPVDAVGAALAKTADMTVLMLRMVGRMFAGDASIDNLSGPIAIAETAGKTASYGLLPFVKFLAAVSISLAVLNLFPIPILDGGHLLYYFIEWIKGSPLSEQAQIQGQRLGMVVLAMLITFAFYVDISRLLG
ncbi:RIP metalloprotease RseP [Thiococcus pfennigii]|jgi:regulator of sigma E protease|uniref:RIP metalloprotease RseP n=1 Tax=Thiococcus pfennigii TaxID=1057 RepID=UPI0019070428|nr:RIP metalloprotease RseP [Thiococcus pfennigii]MBK1730435.1 RIP metalloprotease RseP [Thiococcus pfennigii]